MCFATPFRLERASKDVLWLEHPLGTGGIGCCGWPLFFGELDVTGVTDHPESESKKLPELLVLTLLQSLEAGTVVFFVGLFCHATFLFRLCDGT